MRVNKRQIKIFSELQASVASQMSGTTMKESKCWESPASPGPWTPPSGKGDIFWRNFLEKLKGCLQSFSVTVQLSINFPQKRAICSMCAMPSVTKVKRNGEWPPLVTLTNSFENYLWLKFLPNLFHVACQWIEGEKLSLEQAEVKPRHPNPSLFLDGSAVWVMIRFDPKAPIRG